MDSFASINDLLEQNGLDLNRVGFARHPYRDPNVRYMYDGNYLDLSMSLQNRGKFDSYDYLLSFLGLPDEKCLFLCGYKVQGVESDAGKFLKDYPFQNHISDRSVYYHLIRLPFLEKYNSRILINWGKGAIAWLQNGTNVKTIDEIWDVPLSADAYLKSVSSSAQKKPAID